MSVLMLRHLPLMSRQLKKFPADPAGWRVEISASMPMTSKNWKDKKNQSNWDPKPFRP